MSSTSAGRELLLSAVDLTRACCASDNYLSWIARYAPVLHGAASIAGYLANAALIFEEQTHSGLAIPFDAFDARDTLADLLMSSGPLHSRELKATVYTAIRESTAFADIQGAGAIFGQIGEERTNP